MPKEEIIPHDHPEDPQDPQDPQHSAVSDVATRTETSFQRLLVGGTVVQRVIVILFKSIPFKKNLKSLTILN